MVSLCEIVVDLVVVLFYLPVRFSFRYERLEVWFSVVVLWCLDKRVGLLLAVGDAVDELAVSSTSIPLCPVR